MTARLRHTRAREASDGDFLPLITLLKDQVDVVSDLIKLAREKQHAILGGDHALLETVVAREGKLVGKLRSIEERRASWIAEWATLRSFPPDIPVSQLIDQIPPRQRRAAASLGALSDVLSRSLDELRELNEQNAGLLYHSLAFTRMVLGALTEPDPKSGTYGPSSGKKGEPLPGGSRAIVDRRA